MKDAKGLHEELLLREDFDYRRGWNNAESWVLGFLWGIASVLALIVFGPWS